MSGVGPAATWRYPVATFAALPATAADGTVVIVLDTDEEYEFDATSSTWVLLNSGGGGGTPSATVVSETAYNQASTPGVSSTYSRGDHSHGSPSDANIPTAAEKAALPGTSGAPGAGNKYVTDADPRNTNARTPTLHAASHKHGGTDEIATAVAAANAIPKAGAGSELAAPWIPTMVGDTGAGGVKGAVPAPAIGDAAKFLRGDATWQPAAGALTVKEVDGAPSVAATTIRFPNGSLTDDGGGQVTVAFDTDYVGRFEQAAIGTGDIGLNKWGWWWNTTTSKLFSVRNRAGVLYGVESNPL